MIPNTNVARVVICDDNVMIRKGLQVTLAEAPGFESIGEVEEGPATVAVVSELSPDLVLTDKVARGVSTLNAITQIKDRYPATKVAVYSNSRSREDIITALRAGADGYILKDTGVGELIAAMTIILHGHTYLSPQVIGTVVNTYTLGKNGDTPEGIAALSPREGQVLRLVADGRTSKQIAQHLVISPRTVEKHRARLMRKLGVHSIAALLTIAINSGFVEDVEACPVDCGGDPLLVAMDF